MRGARILVIEDDADLMRLMLHVLKAAGFRAVPAYGGEDAFRKIEQELPDLIVTDLAMPKMTGIEIVERLKADARTRDIPCIAVTAHVWEQIAISANGLCEAFLGKPFTGARLLQEVARFVPLPAKSAA